MPEETVKILIYENYIMISWKYANLYVVSNL
jgi:hypothetical protein